MLSSIELFSFEVVLAVIVFIGLIAMQRHFAEIQKMYTLLFSRGYQKGESRIHIIARAMAPHRILRRLSCIIALFLLLLLALMANELDSDSPSSVAIVFYQGSEEQSGIKIKEQISPQDRERLTQSIVEKCLPTPVSLWLLSLPSNTLSNVVPPTVDLSYLSLIAGEERLYPHIMASSHRLKGAIYIVLSAEKNIPPDFDPSIFSSSFIWCYAPVESGGVENVSILRSPYRFLEGVSLADALSSLQLLIKKDVQDSSDYPWMLLTALGLLLFSTFILWMSFLRLFSSVLALWILAIFIQAPIPGFGNILYSSEYMSDANRWVRDAEFFAAREGLEDEAFSKLNRALELVPIGEPRRRILLALSELSVMALLRNNQSDMMIEASRCMKEALSIQKDPVTDETGWEIYRQIRALFVVHQLSIQERRELTAFLETFIHRQQDSNIDPLLLRALTEELKVQQALVKWMPSSEWPFLWVYQSLLYDEIIPANHHEDEKNWEIAYRFCQKLWMSLFPLIKHEFQRKEMQDLVHYLDSCQSIFSDTQHNRQTLKECSYKAFLAAYLFSRFSALDESEKTGLRDTTLMYHLKAFEFLLEEHLRVQTILQMETALFKESMTAPEFTALTDLLQRVYASLSQSSLSPGQKKLFEELFSSAAAEKESKKILSCLSHLKLYEYIIVIPPLDMPGVSQREYNGYEDLLLFLWEKQKGPELSKEPLLDFFRCDPFCTYMGFAPAVSYADCMSQIFLSWFQRAPIYALSWLKAAEKTNSGHPFFSALYQQVSIRLAEHGASAFQKNSLNCVLAMLYSIDATQNIGASGFQSLREKALFSTRAIETVAYSDGLENGRGLLSIFSYPEAFLGFFKRSLYPQFQSIVKAYFAEIATDESDIAALLRKIGQLIDVIADPSSDSLKNSSSYQELFTLALLIEEQILSSHEPKKKNQEILQSQRDKEFENRGGALSADEAVSLYRKMDMIDRRDELNIVQSRS